MGSRRRAGELRRSRTFEAATLSTATRSSTSSNGDPPGDDKLSQLYRKVKQCHRGKNASVLEGTDRTTKRPVIIKAYAKQGMTAVKREKVEREVAVLKATAGCPNVVRLLNTVDDPLYHYTVLESVPGGLSSGWGGACKCMAPGVRGPAPKSICLPALICCS